MDKRNFLKPEPWLENWRKKRRDLKQSDIYGRSLRGKWSMLKSHCKKRKRSCDLTQAQYQLLIEQGCYYCGTLLLNSGGVSLDRKDNRLGYNANNVIPCCGDCNRIRNIHLTVDEMKVGMTAILEFRRDQNLKEKKS